MAELPRRRVNRSAGCAVSESFPQNYRTLSRWTQPFSQSSSQRMSYVFSSLRRLKPKNKARLARCAVLGGCCTSSTCPFCCGQSSQQYNEPPGISPGGSLYYLPIRRVLPGEDYLPDALMLICFGCACGSFGRVIFSTPFSKLASTLSVSTVFGRRMLRSKLPVRRSR